MNYDPHRECYVRWNDNVFLRIPPKTGNVYFNNNKSAAWKKQSLNYAKKNKMKSLIVIRDPIKRWVSGYIFCMKHQYAGLSYLDIPLDKIKSFVNRQYDTWLQSTPPGHSNWHIDHHMSPIWTTEEKNHQWDYVCTTETFTTTLQELCTNDNWSPHVFGDNQAEIKYNVVDLNDLFSDQTKEKWLTMYADDIKYYNKYCSIAARQPYVRDFVI